MRQSFIKTITSKTTSEGYSIPGGSTLLPDKIKICRDMNCS